MKSFTAEWCLSCTPCIYNWTWVSSAQVHPLTSIWLALFLGPAAQPSITCPGNKASICTSVPEYFIVVSVLLSMAFTYKPMYYLPLMTSEIEFRS